ncbi:MAG: zinc-ribbon domain-containing protein [Nitrososphaerales archaeon]
MPACPVCGKDVQQDASFCTSCGSNLQPSTSQNQQVSSQPSFPMQEQIPVEQQLKSMVKRLERISYITATAAGILLIVIILVLF